MPKLTDIAIKNAKGGKKVIKLSDGQGLALLVYPNGSKYWAYRYRWLGKEKTLSLGVYPEVGLAEARQKLIDARKMLSERKDPSEARKAVKRQALYAAENDFESIAREWHTTNLNTWTPKHGANVIKRLEGDIFPKLGGRPINDISAPEMLSVLRIIEKRGVFDLTQTISQYCGRIFAVLCIKRNKRNLA